jgi:hypothetical protein
LVILLPEDSQLSITVTTVKYSFLFELNDSCLLSIDSGLKNVGDLAEPHDLIDKVGSGDPTSFDDVLRGRTIRRALSITRSTTKIHVPQDRTDQGDDDRRDADVEDRGVDAEDHFITFLIF